MTLTRHVTGSIVATACWSNFSGSNTLRMWPGTGREVEVTLIMEPESIPGRTRVENVPFGCEGQRELLWQVNASATCHVLRGVNGTVLARWDIIGNRPSQQDAIELRGSNDIPGDGTESRNLDDDVRTHFLHARSGLHSPAPTSTSGVEDDNEIGWGGNALRSAGEPLLTILAAPSGTAVNDSMWVEFVVASGVCVLIRGM